MYFLFVLINNIEWSKFFFIYSIFICNKLIDKKVIAGLVCVHLTKNLCCEEVFIFEDISLNIVLQEK